jgi:hypothetical protein
MRKKKKKVIGTYLHVRNCNLKEKGKETKQRTHSTHFLEKLKRIKTKRREGANL